MKSLMFCVVFCFSTSQTLYTYFGEHYSSEDNWDTFVDMNCKLHEFTYRKGDNFVLWMGSYEKNSSTSAPSEPKSAYAIISMQPGVKWFRKRIGRGRGNPTKMQFYLDHDTITIYIQINTEKTCDELKVLKGTMLPEWKNVTTSEFNEMCLGGNQCIILVYESAVCKGRQSQQCGYYKREEEKNLDAKNTPTATRNCSACLTPTNTSITPRQTDNLKKSFKDGADNTYYTIMIVALVTSAVAVILLLIIAIRQRCWFRSESPGMIHISPFQNRYYENVVFRTETDPGVDDVVQQEQRIYDEPSCAETQHHTGRTQN